MSWEAIGAISEIVGTIAVVVSLVYVGVQIKQSTVVARSSARQSVTESMLQTASNLVEDPTLAASFLKEIRGEKLDPVEQLRLFGRAYLSMRSWENVHYQYRTGMLTEEEWHGFRRNLEAILEWPSMRRYWENEKQFYSPAFRSEVDRILATMSNNAEAKSHAYVATAFD